ncbi:hypothetical protein [Sediminibacterium ginsengisoli]|uniref:Uncharacterized protein n=1 Tax=Sediminibacterium ginsengisoli TaxID=413434 RepID=A0A1T4QZX1_9BACT|nr:hypothetical protein [Sediminibacterium ginsengisoli]SKA09362.1 hypothetical protein SAMN04488132_11031 [Sediminibacterium ginsengisoli]
MTNRQFFKFLFHKKSIPLAGFLVFMWFAINAYVDLNMTSNELIPHTGELIRIDSVITRVKNKPFFKEITKELRLALEGETSYFTYATTSHFGDITAQINVGDYVTVYSNPKKSVIFGFKKKNDIWRLTKGDAVIINYADYQRMIRKSIPVCWGISLFFLVWFLVWARPRWRSIT